MNMTIGILICSIDKDNILLNCLDTLVNKTTYKNYKIYLCVPPSIRKRLEIQLLNIPNEIIYVYRGEEEPYKYSIFVNRLVEACQEDIIVLMNDDTEVITADWMEQMLIATLPTHIGVVGCKLLFPNRTIQHAGCIFSSEYICRLAHYGKLDSLGGIWNEDRYYLAVSPAACMMRKSIYKEVDGYEEKLVAFNDMDFGLKLTKKGYRNLYLAGVSFIHYESYTRGAEAEFLQGDCDFMRNKWGSTLDWDPYYNKEEQ